jgi:hypothetical protein
MSAAPADGFVRLADVLSWTEDPRPGIFDLRMRYAEALTVQLGRAIGRTLQHAPAEGEQLVARAGELAPEQLVQRLRRPATARRLTTRLHSVEDVTSHLLGVLAEPTEPTESAVPDRPAPAAYVLGTVPLLLDPAGDPELVAAGERIEQEMRRLEEIVPEAVSYVRTVMQELWLVRDDTKDGFFSNSPQGFIGRAVLTNPHLAMVDAVMLVEAVVHEATHGFVGMSEAIGLAGLDPAERWLLDDGPYDGVSRVASAWTGKPLDIPTYLHACFVWWGLLRLWSRVTGTGTFDEGRVRSRLMRAASGFLDSALVAELRPHAGLIQPALLHTLDDLGTSVDAALRVTGLGEKVAVGSR